VYSGLSVTNREGLLPGTASFDVTSKGQGREGHSISDQEGIASPCQGSHKHYSTSLLLALNLR
jgi:hypothetical protein